MNESRRVIAAVAVTLGLGLLTACTPPAEPLVTTVVWVDGEPQGSFETEPTVEAARWYERVAAAANNARDFSGAEIAGAMSGELATALTADLRSQIERDDARPFAGPRAFEVISVDPLDEAETYAVETCAQQRPQGPGETNDGTVHRTYTVDASRDPALVIGVSQGGECMPASPLAIAEFDPAPSTDGWDALTPESVTGP